MRIKINNCPYYLLILCHFITNFSFGQVDNISSKTFPIRLEENTLRIPYYSNYDLFTENKAIDKAIIVIHGTNRNADEYYENMTIAARKVPEFTANTLIMAPQFLTETDIDGFDLDESYLYWTNGGWKSGSNSRDENSNPRPGRIPSYAVLDSLLIHLANQFPTLSSIVFTGHSAGGQVTQRMAATSPIAEQLCSIYNVGIRFVVANPSSYVYMDEQRKLANSTTEFAVPTNACATYNEWKYGLADLFTYPRNIGILSIRNTNQQNTVTYLLGANDNNPNSSSLDIDCEASLQGAHRLERGQVYFNYLQHYYGETIKENHDLIIVPNVGHSNFDMYNSVEGIEVLFERETADCSETVSLIEYPSNVPITIFPNPVIDKLNFSWSVPFNQKIQVTVFDLHGRPILSNRAISLTDQLDVSILPRGIYILAITATEGNAYVRFIIP